MPTQRKPRPLATVTVDYHIAVARPMAKAIAVCEIFPLKCIAKQLQKYADKYGCAVSDQRVIGNGPEGWYVEQRTWERALEDELRAVGHKSPQVTAEATIVIALLLDYAPRRLGCQSIISILAEEYPQYCTFRHLAAFFDLFLGYDVPLPRNQQRETNARNLQTCHIVLGNAEHRSLTATQLKREINKLRRDFERKQILNEIEAVKDEI